MQPLDRDRAREADRAAEPSEMDGGHAARRELAVEHVATHRAWMRLPVGSHHRSRRLPRYRMGHAERAVRRATVLYAQHAHRHLVVERVGHGAMEEREREPFQVRVKRVGTNAVPLASLPDAGIRRDGPPRGDPGAGRHRSREPGSRSRPDCPSPSHMATKARSGLARGSRRSTASRSSTRRAPSTATTAERSRWCSSTSAPSR